ncbi:MAG: efflux RND transporter permease subunit [Elusimicrobia bacterium]|nr:efflux RND transporter permease subunit [Elusimicrobiota bacterium]
MQEKNNEKKYSGLAAFFIHRPVFTIMVSVSLMLLGLMGYLNMGVSLYPSMDIPATLVQTVLPGASPEEVETSVTKYIEEAVNEISGVDEISAFNLESVSILFVKFEMDKNADVGIQEVRDKIEQVKSKFPDGTESPVVLKLDMDAAAVLNVVVTGNRDIIELTELAKKQVKEVIENTSGVGSVSIVGGREREIHVTLDPLKLYSLQIPITSVTSALAQQNFEIPGGKVEQNHNSYSLRILGRIPSVEEFKNIFVATKNGVPIKLSDVATVEDSGEYEQQSTRLDGQRCVTLEIKKQSGSNTLKVIDGVKEKIKMIEQTLPPDMKIVVMSDQSGSIRASVNTVLEHLCLGAILAGIMVLIFMGSLRSTFIAFLAIPISVVGAFIFMSIKGFTLNSITLLGLTVAVGIVIDDAIVMLENIYRHMEKYNKTPIQAAVDGSKEITATIIATTLAILVIFLPLAYMGGMVGRVLSSYGWTVVFAIALSGIVALTLTPMLCSKLLVKASKRSRIDKIVNIINMSLVKRYIPMLNWSIHHKLIMVVFSIVIFVAGIFTLFILGGDFFPVEDTGKVQVQVKAEEGTSYPDMINILAQMEEDVRRLPYIKSVLNVTGKGADGLSSFASSAPTNKGYLEIELEDREKRKRIKTTRYVESIRNMLSKYDGLKITVLVKSDGPGSGNKDTQLSLLGPDLNKLMDYANATAEKLSKDSRFRDIDLSVDMAKPEYRVVINRDKANNLGVNVTAVAAALRTMVGGEDDITKYKEGDELYEVRVRVAEQYRNTKESISALMIPANIDGQSTVVRLDSIAELEEGFGPSQINRKARQREVRVEANLNGIDTMSATKIMQNTFLSLNPEIGYTVAQSGQAKEMGKMFVSFAFAFLLAFIFKYIVLCCLMEKFTHPIAIIITLPLTIPFALFSLFVAHQSLNIFTLLGMFMLVGVVSKNAILQTDYTNQLRARGYGRTNAILQANKVRLRPILMTTLTLVVSMIPMLISNGEGADVRRGLAIVIVGGQLLSLLVTLLMTPVTYIIVDSIGDWIKYKIYKIPMPKDKDADVILDEVPDKY